MPNIQRQLIVQPTFEGNLEHSRATVSNGRKGPIGAESDKFDVAVALFTGLGAVLPESNKHECRLAILVSGA